ncbi:MULTISPECIES: 6,7-dimethyl-8-ribityllumazine synthase [Nonlabens]|uniref:6,7-dimethyl-8-ribityllumazine synthase n=1 Tax=Nonlabens xylanidelens TaxID=191564 RepID=A0A2S6IL20_9FLAO|nr:6,7-dimethyl-8-ribityllumazine synthase [Nonlabens xylanidelens]PPK94866.1 6,7-dimethyl-8-ribityllumazine synthase [Nonlabens xylanidelens]PQJ17415.1 6,7-dimethyl-8-ribityllumazine synthase [Nonlabens xylanidelens]
MATVGKDLSHYDKESMPDATDMRIGIVVSEWNDDITENLFKGAQETLLDCGIDPERIFRMDVPGSFELIYGCKNMQYATYPIKDSKLRKPLDAVIAIGSVIRGETAHFDFVCNGVTSGIKDLNLNKSRVPVIFCVLTDNTHEQSVARSGGIHGNKGSEAAVAAIKMAAIKQGL